MEQFVGVLGALLIFGAIIVVHEFGHFIVAKLTGMGVYEFSIGFGPAIFKRTKNDTLYALRIIPLGGYVRIAGMELGEEDAPNGYDKKSFGAKFATLFAGAFMNFVLALVIFIVLGMAIGYYRSNPQPVIGDISPKTPAARAGIKAGDRIVAINDAPVMRWDDAVKKIRTSKGKVDIRLERQGRPFEVAVMPMTVDYPERHGLRIRLVPTRVIGMSADGAYQRMGPIHSIANGFSEVKERTLLVVASLVSMVTRDIPVKDIGGPIMVMRASYSASQGALSGAMGMADVLGFLAFLSVNIGLMNLLPIPALDGGRLFFLLIEGIRRKPMDREKEAYIHAVGMAVLLFLILLISVKDIVSWIGVGK